MRSSANTWLARVEAAQWQNMSDVQADFPKASVLNGERARFEVAGGNYRLIAAIKFNRVVNGRRVNGTVFIKFIGSHSEYDAVDALSVSQF